MGGPLPPRRTYRLPELLVASTLVAVWLLVVAWRGDGVDHVVMPVLAWVFLLLGWWPRVVADQNGVQVVNMRRHTLSWDEVVSIDLARSGWKNAYADVLTITTVDGRQLACWAVSPLRNGAGRWHCGQVCDELRRRQRLAAGRTRAKQRRAARARRREEGRRP